VNNVQARTIHPDGKIVEWSGKLLDKTIVKARGYKVQAKTLTLPEVEVGSIIEYRYRKTFNTDYLFDNTWEVQRDLYTRLAKFSYLARSGTLYGLLWTKYLVTAPISQGKDR